MMTSKKDLLRTLLKGIETGDPASAAVVNEAKYIQHNPQTQEGSEGLAQLFARLAKTNPRVRFVRVFEDGDFAFAHNEYDFASLRVAFEVFRFEDGQAVEHWDNIQPMRGPNASGRAMLDGATTITDLHKTETNRAHARAFVQDILVGRRFDGMGDYLARDVLQHDPDCADGLDAWRGLFDGDQRRTYDHLHKVLAEGNFVLCMSEGWNAGKHSSFYDLFRIEDDCIIEHWNTIETIAPRAEWKNDNGKF